MKNAKNKRLHNKRKLYDDIGVALSKAQKKQQREEEIAKYGKQISMYYWVGDKKHHPRGGKHKKRF